MLANCCKTTSKFIYSSNEIILKTKIKKRKKSITSSNITIAVKRKHFGLQIQYIR
jgi:hypothetical protein